MIDDLVERTLSDLRLDGWTVGIYIRLAFQTPNSGQCQQDIQCCTDEKINIASSRRGHDHVQAFHREAEPSRLHSSFGSQRTLLEALQYHEYSATLRETM